MLRGKIPHFRLTSVAQKRLCLSSLIYCLLDNKLFQADRRIGKPLAMDYYKRTMHYPFLDHLLAELDSRSIKTSPLFTITNLLPKNVGNWSPLRSVSKKFCARRIQTSRKKVDNYRKVTKSQIQDPGHLRHFLPITTATIEVFQSTEKT